MPFIANTPESSPGVIRSDSRNPSTTCRGITSTGQACKRALPHHKLSAASGNEYEVAEDHYCWQHKSQAQRIRQSSIRPATSVETLLERLKINDKQSSRAKKDGSEVHQTSRSSVNATRQGARSRRPKTSSRLCCFTLPDEDEDDHIEIVRHKHRKNRQPQSGASIAAGQDGNRNPSHEFHKQIPPNLPLDVKVQLQRELTKPFSDCEPGYIYVYRKILMSNSDSKIGHVGLSDLPQTTGQRATPRKILIKIGYTNNVQKRLSTWSNRCRSQIELLRYYPYVPTSGVPRKAPYCRKVERLVHIELGERRVEQPCECGATHREWFEIDASIQAVKAVNEVIQRWIAWAEYSMPAQ